MTKIELFVLPKFFENNKLVLNRLGKVYDICVTYFDLMNKLEDIFCSENHKEDHIVLFSYSIPDFFTLMNGYEKYKEEFSIVITAIYSNRTWDILYDSENEMEFYTIPPYIEKERSIENGDFDEDFHFVKSDDLLENIMNEVVINSYDILTSDLLDELLHSDDHSEIHHFYDLIEKSVLPTYKYTGEVYRIEFDDDGVFKPIGYKGFGMHIIERFTTKEDFERIRELFSHFKLRESDVKDFNDVHIAHAHIENFKFFTRNGYLFYFTYDESTNSLKIHIENIMTETNIF